MIDSPYSRLHIFLENGQDVGSNHAHPGEEEQVISRSHEGTGRYYFFVLIAQVGWSFSKHSLVLVLSHSVQQEKKPEFYTMPASECH